MTFLCLSISASHLSDMFKCYWSRPELPWDSTLQADPSIAMSNIHRKGITGIHSWHDLLAIACAFVLIAVCIQPSLIFSLFGYSQHRSSV